MVGAVLVTLRRAIDQEFAAGLGAVGMIHLALDRKAARIATLAARILPDDDEVAIGKHAHLWIFWSPLVVVLTRNSAPALLPSALKR